MSQTAPGTFVRTSSTNFTAVFSIDGIPYTFNGNLDKGVEAFSSNSAKLTYSSTEDLTGARTFDAVFKNTCPPLTFTPLTLAIAMGANTVPPILIFWSFIVIALGKFQKILSLLMEVVWVGKFVRETSISGTLMSA